MLGLLIPTVSTWFNQGSLPNQVNGTSSSNLTGANAAQSSTTPTNGTQLANAFENLIAQLNAATAPSAGTTASSAGSQVMHGRSHGHGGAALGALLQQLDELTANSSGVNSAAASSAVSSASSSTASGTAAGTASPTPAIGTASASNVEATLNQLLQTLKLANSNTNVAALSSATGANGAANLARRLAQQGFQARTGSLLTAVV